MGRVYAISNRLQYYKDKLKGQFRYRWISTFVLACFYGIRVYLHGYCIVTFFLAGLLSLCAFLFSASSTDDDKPEAPPILPIKETDELKPFVPFLNEFTFWVIVNMLFCVASSLTFIPKLNDDMPMYPYGYMFFVAWLWLNLTIVLELRGHMKKYKYIPFYYGDKKQGEYKGK